MLFKVLILTILGGLFIGCGGGSGPGDPNKCFAGGNSSDIACSLTRKGAGANNTSNAGDSKIDFYSIENNFSYSEGYFHISQSNVMANLSLDSIGIGKEIIYHNVSGELVTALYKNLDFTHYAEIECPYVGVTDLYCQAFYSGTDPLLPTGTVALVVFDQAKSDGCGNGCDVTLMLRGYPPYDINISKAIQINDFKRVFSKNEDNNRTTILQNIENEKSGVNMVKLTKWFYSPDITQKSSDIDIYISQLGLLGFSKNETTANLDHDGLTYHFTKFGQTETTISIDWSISAQYTDNQFYINWKN
jgi:hypothetical protein